MPDLQRNVSHRETDKVVGTCHLEKLMLCSIINLHKRINGEVSHMKWITAAEIDDWTTKEPRRVQELLPQLVWKLILGSCTHINDHHFPYGKAIQYSGYDGFLDTNDEHQFVPIGKSVWEFGTDADVKRKLNSDYQKRTENPNGIALSETTFCFVTTRIWKHQLGIVEATEEKNSEGKWKSVRIYDANSLEMWLEKCPVVSTWLAELMGKSYRNICDLGMYWEKQAKGTNPNLTTEFFTHAREAVSDQVLRLIAAGASQIILVGESTKEAALTLAAELENAEKTEHLSLKARCLVVDAQEAYLEASQNCLDAILIPLFYPESGAFASYEGIVLIPVCKYDPLDLMYKTENRIEIPTRSRHEFCQALEKLGYETCDAYSMGTDLRCKFNALYRRIATSPTDKIPNWSRNEGLDKLLPALFAGSWEDRKTGDRALISAIAGMPYEEYISAIQPYAKGENAPLFCLDGSYACIATADLWDTLWSEITQDVFVRFGEAIIELFSETDPAYDLPKSQWLMASVLGKESKYSEQIKRSCIVSITMLTDRENSSGASFSAHISETCKAWVKRIFEGVQSLNQWRTLCPYLAEFMEATPDVVLHRLEDASERQDSPFWDLFAVTDSPLFERTFYTHILWALENAVWDKRYASRALNLLVRFAEKELRYTQSNCPLDSLYRIFCLWHPQGCFSLDERKILLQNIISNHHTIAAELIDKLLPDSHQMTHNIAKPRWRAIESEMPIIHVAEYEEMVQFVSTVYIDNITPSFRDWKTVLRNLDSFDPIENVAGKCTRLISSMPEDEVFSLCAEIARYISNCRSYHHDNDASMHRADILEALLFSVLPDNPRRYAVFFSNNFNGLTPYRHRENDYDYDEEQKCIHEFHKEIMTELVARYDKEVSISIIPYVENTRAYATAIAEDVMQGKFDWALVEKLRAVSEEVASYVIADLYWLSGLNSLVSTDNKPGKADMGWVLSCIQLKEEIAEFVESTGDRDCQRAYWEQVSVWGLQREDKETIDKYVKILLMYNRPFSLIDYLAYSKWNTAELVIQVLEAALKLYPDSEPNGLTLERVGTSNIEKMFQKLYEQEEMPEFEIAKLELQYLRVFDHKFEPKFLVDQVLQHPALYMELLSTAYRADDDRSDLPPQANHYAGQAYEALDRIQRIPGYDAKDKVLDTIAFKKWFADVNELAKSSGYTLANDIVLGHILSYAPEGTDGIWPTECVRQVFETFSSEELERSFITGKHNQRGVYNVTGGREENELADKYASIADKLQLLYPKTSAVIRRLSEDYRAEAKRERVRELKGFT